MAHGEGEIRVEMVREIEKISDMRQLTALLS